MHDGMQYDPIQGQGHEGANFIVKLALLLLLLLLSYV